MKIAAIGGSVKNTNYDRKIPDTISVFKNIIVIQKLQKLKIKNPNITGLVTHKTYLNAKVTEIDNTSCYQV